MPPLLLALETATDVCGVALARGDRLLAELTLARPRAHAETLVPLIQDALRYATVEAADLDAVVVSAGPGSYTGLRIGTSTAKGLAAATGAALVAVSSLEAVASAAAALASPGDQIGVAFNARRDEVYAALYAVDDQHHLHEERPPAALPLDALAAWVEAPRGPLWLAGEGAERVRTHLPDPNGASVVPVHAVGPAARHVAALGYRRFMAGTIEDLASFEPQYLKDFVAKKPQGSVFERLSF